MEDSKVKPCFVGIDVSKDTLDICLLPQKKRFQVENKNFNNLCKRLKLYSPELIVMEPTGGYEMALYNALREAGFRVSREHALKLYHHRKSRGRWGKTDRADAESIAHYAQSYTHEIDSERVPEASQEELRQLVGRRTDLVKMQTMERNRSQMPNLTPELKASCDNMLNFLEREIASLDKAIREKVSNNADWRQKRKLLQSVPGIAEIGANTLIACLPELGNLKTKQLAALAGVAPYHYQSGLYKGKSHIRGGRKTVRTALFMAILSAITHNPLLKTFYKELQKRGKPKKVALVACMHKLLRILNAMFKQNKSFQARPA